MTQRCASRPALRPFFRDEGNEPELIFATDRRGGREAQFVVDISKHKKHATPPTHFLLGCMVGDSETIRVFTLTCCQTVLVVYAFIAGGSRSGVHGEYGCQAPRASLFP